MNRKGAMAAVTFPVAGIAMLAVLNLHFSPGYIWFYYAAYAALWWPLAVFVSPRRRPLGFALAGSAITAVFLAIVNWQNTPARPWFLFAVYPLILWPAKEYFEKRGKAKPFSIVCCVLTIPYLIALNVLTSPGHPWCLYACFPLLYWPIIAYLGKKAGTLTFAWIASAAAIAYYTALNVFISPGFPWAICTAFAVLWWPLSMSYARKKAWVRYSITMSIWTIVFLFALNHAASPEYLWAFFPAFAILWWPLSMIFIKHRAWVGYAIAGTLLLSVGFIALNAMVSPGVIWAIYPIFAALWWPVAMIFARRRKWLAFAIAGAALISAFLIAVNRITSPGTMWAVFPVFAVLWWPLSVYFFRHRRRRAARQG